MNKKPILVTGAHRSGTTWIGKMLSLSPDIYYVDEPFHLDLRKGKSPVNKWFEYVSNSSDKEKQDKFFNYFSNFTTNSFFAILSDIKQVRGKRSFINLFENYIKRKKQRALIKDPIAFFSTEWLFQHFNCDVVVLIRHPAAFTGSLKVKNWEFDFNNLLDQPDLINNYVPQFADLIKEYSINKKDIIQQGCLLWNIIYSTVKILNQKYPNWIFIRHEDISFDPLGQFKFLYTKLGIGKFEDVQNKITSSTLSTDPQNNFVRNSKENIFNWKNRLTNSELKTVLEETKDLFEYFYPEERFKISS